MRIMGTKFKILHKLRVNERTYIFGELLNKDSKFDVLEGAKLGEIPIEPYLDIPRKIDEKGRIRLDVFVFLLKNPSDENKIKLEDEVELTNTPK